MPRLQDTVNSLDAKEREDILNWLCCHEPRAVMEAVKRVERLRMIEEKRN